MALSRVSKNVTVSHTKFPTSVVVMEVISSKGNVMLPHFFEEGLKITAIVYIHVPDTVKKSRIDKIATAGDHTFLHDSAPAHRELKTQTRLFANVPHHWSLAMWPPFSTGFNSFDKHPCGIVEESVISKLYSPKEVLRARITEVMISMYKEEVKRAHSRF